MTKKIFLLSSAESTHTARWANAIVNSGFEVYLISQQPLKHKLDEKVKFIELKYKGGLSYFLNTKYVRALINEIKPDYIHAHFASGYGTLAKNIGHPYLLSVWGSDVYDFPSSFFKRFLLKRALKGATKIFSTSHCMKTQTEKFTDKPITVIPFGVDLTKFKPISLNKTDVFELGIVKVIDKKYGIDVLLNAIALLSKMVQEKFKLTIIGDGPQLSEMKLLSESLDIKDLVEFIGWVPNDELPRYLNSFDVFLVPSRLDSESFGVAAVEAGACELPCIVSNVGGLPEVIIDSKTGIVVPKEDPQELANAIKYLLENRSVGISMGIAARENVTEKYDWEKNVKTMTNYYE